MDRLIRGFIVGVVAAVIKDALNLFSFYVLHLSKLRYADFISVILLGHKINNTPDFVLSQILELGYAGSIGVLFIFFAYKTYNKCTLWFKGIFFGEIAFLFAYSLGTFFRLPDIYRISAGTAISQFITSAIYGIIMGLGIYWWENKVGGFNSQANTKSRKVVTNVITEEFAEDNETGSQRHLKTKLKKPKKI